MIPSETPGPAGSRAGLFGTGPLRMRPGSGSKIADGDELQLLAADIARIHWLPLTEARPRRRRPGGVIRVVPGMCRDQGHEMQNSIRIQT
jgi:hypothetical protein